MTDVVDVLVEAHDGACFQMASVSEAVLQNAVKKATSDGSVLSLVSLDSAALVIPWPLVQRVSCAPVVSEEGWRVLWDIEAKGKSNGRDG